MPPRSAGVLSALARSALFFLDARLSPTVVQSGDFELTGMLAILEAKKQELGAGLDRSSTASMCCWRCCRIPAPKCARSTACATGWRTTT